MECWSLDAMGHRLRLLPWYEVHQVHLLSSTRCCGHSPASNMAVLCFQSTLTSPEAPVASPHHYSQECIRQTSKLFYRDHHRISDLRSYFAVTPTIKHLQLLKRNGRVHSRSLISTEIREISRRKAPAHLQDNITSHGHVFLRSQIAHGVTQGTSISNSSTHNI